MALSQSSLASLLEDVGLAGSEAEAIEKWASAWTTYFEDAETAATPLSGSLDAAKSAMAAAMIGMNAPGGAAAALAAGISAFWTAVNGAAATLWLMPPNVVVSVAPPPTLGSLVGALTTVFAANVSSGASPAEAADGIATALHTNGGVGGIATIQPPAPGAPFPSPVT